MKKRIDGYHRNKTDKTRAFFVDTDGSIKRQELRPDRRYFGMELELEFDGNISLNSDDDTCGACGGRGHVECPTCHGQPHECSHCSGFGFTGDGIPCEHCGRTGAVACPTCASTGRVECGECHGTGHIENTDDSVFDVPAPWDDAVVYESDGSLRHGFEVINEPMTYNAMVKYIESDYMAKLLAFNRARDSNGVHIHVSKVNMDHTQRVQMILARLSKELAGMTRSSSYARWYHDKIGSVDLSSTIETSDPDFFGGNHTFLMYQYLMGNNALQSAFSIRDAFSDRYMCLNVTNSATLEFRFFNSTKDKERLIKYLNLVNSIMALADLDEPLAWYACADYTIRTDWTVDAVASTQSFSIISRTDPTITGKPNLPDNLRSAINAMTARSNILGAYEQGDTVCFDGRLCVTGLNLGDVSNDVLRELRNASYGVIQRFNRVGEANRTSDALNPYPDYYVVHLYLLSGDFVVSRAIPSYLIAGRVTVNSPVVMKKVVSCN